MRFIGIFFRALKSLTFSKLLKVFSIGIMHPLFAFLYTYASLRAFQKAKELYPKTNSNSGKGNAFRHAYWCCLIMMYFCKVSSPEKSLKWCKKLTDMHEDLFPNQPLETKMDRHNNQVGMDYFMSLLPGVHRQFFESSFFVDELRKKTKNAVLIKSLDEQVGNDVLIYLE
ncbi:hypothetical protein SAMN05660493_02521 [Epilithonimonas bovis DSM 19482]|uniref:DUF6973 domain-containing protein n=1 Tax=Epilithonimonas bovis DSM 19482 TaxID=1121284 RepID=A0A1U7PZ10_9FLAO|nr:hypothetical protein [Epilithonimonas bovis]SIT97794.1 hypothetical protein SAMN05660493_02521 [Epilithonimonas bovis DSM 19482]